ncbi:MAG TPA: succinylglutamate desuccinylase/aspartoacylase family protein [Candidatus Saccharimonadales bacterium]
MKNVLIVGSQHGNELLGEKLYAYIMKQPPEAALHVAYVLANPEARKRGIRFVESDMNRSFTRDDTYEAERAIRLKALVQDGNYDLVIDAHTTTVAQAPCLIISGIREDNKTYLRATHIKNIVVMKHEFLAQSLIGNVPRAVSVEVSNDDLCEKLFGKLHEDLLDFAKGTGSHPHKSVFVVEGLLEKGRLSDDQIAQLRNFEQSEAGFYPVLVGENSYKKQTNYLGFLAKVKQEVTI